jgi:hypothetical protein
MYQAETTPLNSNAELTWSLGTFRKTAGTRRLPKHQNWVLRNLGAGFSEVPIPPRATHGL